MTKAHYLPNESAKEWAAAVKQSIEELQQLIADEETKIAPDKEKLEAIKKKIVDQRFERNEIRLWDKIWSHKKSDKLIKEFYDAFSKERIKLFEQYKEICQKIGTITMSKRRYEKRLKEQEKSLKLLENPSKYQSLTHTERQEIEEAMKRTKWPDKKRNEL